MSPDRSSATPCEVRPAEAWRAINWFRRTERNEESFYPRFERMPPERLGVLLAWWDTTDTWTVFRRICAYWGTGRTGPRLRKDDARRGLKASRPKHRLERTVSL